MCWGRRVGTGTKVPDNMAAQSEMTVWLMVGCGTPAGLHVCAHMSPGTCLCGGQSVTRGIFLLLAVLFFEMEPGTYPGQQDLGIIFPLPLQCWGCRHVIPRWASLPRL